MAAARRNVRAAELLLADEIPENAAGAAYYAMLNAASAAILQRGRDAKTHPGTWTLFSELFVKAGEVDKELYKASQRAKELRVAADYRGSGASMNEAREAVDDARRFVDAVGAAAGLSG